MESIEEFVAKFEELANRARAEHRGRPLADVSPVDLVVLYLNQKADAELTKKLDKIIELLSK